MPATLELPPQVEFDKVKWLAYACQSSFEFFMREFWGEIPGVKSDELKWNWHLSYLCKTLQQDAERVFQGLPRLHDRVYNLPPGTSKSSIVSIGYPCWIWCRMPRARIITGSHTESLVLDLSGKSRDVIKSEKYRELFPEVRIRHDRDAKGEYANTVGGERRVSTVGGKSPLGFHAHFLIIDDPIDPQKVLSDLERNTAGEYMTKYIANRKVDKEVAFTVLVMQRLGVQDPTDIFLEQAKKEGAAKVEHVCLPAELKKDEYGKWKTGNVKPPELTKKYINGLMDPIRLNRTVLNENKARGALFYATQFDQEPYIAGGGMFKDIYFNKRVKAAPYNARRVRYYDRACLIAGTMVETSNGPKPIEKIKVGEFVLTRKGYKRVKWAGATKTVTKLVKVDFNNGASIIATPEHKIWTENRGWIEIDSIVSSDYNLYVTTKGEQSWPTNETQILNPFNLKEFGFPVKKENATIKPYVGANSLKNIGQIRYTEQFGVPITEKISPKVLTYITKTETGITTNQKILSAFPEQITIDYTEVLSNGTKQRPLQNYEKKIMTKHGQTCLGKNISANNAKKYSNQGTLAKPLNFVLHCVVADLEEMPHLKNVRCVEKYSSVDRDQIHVLKNVPKCIGLNNAQFAENPLTDTKNLTKYVVAENAEQKAGIVVYDLEVTDCHEFFANGVLVHNSTDSGGCATAGTLLAWDGMEWFIEDCVWGQWEPTERDNKMVATALKDRQRYGPNNEPDIVIEHEPGSAGVDAYKHTAAKLAGFRVWPDRPTGDKETRAEPWSSQLASGNVYVVDDGKHSWDIQAYIDEHVAFPGAKMKDRIDSSSGGFNWLLKKRQTAPTIRIYSRNFDQKKNTQRIVVCNREEINLLMLEQRVIVVFLTNPDIIEMQENHENNVSIGSEVHHVNGALTKNLSNGSVLGVAGTVAGLSPPPYFIKQLDAITLQFADIQPSEHQDRWGDIIPGYGRTAAEVLFTPQVHGKKLWAILTRKRPDPWEILVLCDNGEGDRRADSIAKAVADTMGLPRTVIWTPSNDDNKFDGKALNQHVYDCVKNARSLVIT